MENRRTFLGLGLFGLLPFKKEKKKKIVGWAIESTPKRGGQSTYSLFTLNSCYAWTEFLADGTVKMTEVTIEEYVKLEVEYRRKREPNFLDYRIFPLEIEA